MNQQEDGDYSPLEEDFKLWRFLGHTSYAISRLRERELAKFGLTPEQANVLDILNVHGGETTIGEIVNITLRRHHTVTTLVDRMAKHGLVEQRRVPDDRRKLNIVMTDTGWDLFQKVSSDSIRMAFSTLSKDEKKELGSLLSRLLSHTFELDGKEFDFQAVPIPCDV